MCLHLCHKDAPSSSLSLSGKVILAPSKKPPQQVVLSLPSRSSLGKWYLLVPAHSSYLPSLLAPNYSIITFLAITPTGVCLIFPCNFSRAFHNVPCSLLMKTPPMASLHFLWVSASSEDSHPFLAESWNLSVSLLSPLHPATLEFLSHSSPVLRLPSYSKQELP